MSEKWKVLDGWMAKVDALLVEHERQVVDVAKHIPQEIRDSSRTSPRKTPSG